ncbi:hypothetical protein Zmor_020591 [Zophobas morio]|uniref:Uncharacterized protein n=1 Tax=Zophobas morio TaxID=2755281 RepID=A0AA38M9T0_9CUCU|nr:hypothetical protein Zmor_020591 [Zophobas morio]
MSSNASTIEECSSDEKRSYGSVSASGGNLFHPSPPVRVGARATSTLEHTTQGTLFIRSSSNSSLTKHRLYIHSVDLTAIFYSYSGPKGKCPLARNRLKISPGELRVQSSKDETLIG